MYTIVILALLGFVFSPATGSGGRQEVMLVLQLEKTTFAPLEPVVIQYSVVNDSAADVSVPRMIDLEAGWVRFEVATADGPFKRFRTGAYARVPFENTTLKPHERLSAQLVMQTNSYGRQAQVSLLRDLKGTKVFPFADPGSYRVRATYPLDQSDSGDHQSVLESNVLEISVRRASEAEQESLAFFATTDELAAAVGGDSEVEDLGVSVKHWEEFAEQFPDSPYAPYVRLNLASIYLNGTLGSPDPERAMSHYGAVLEAGPRAVADDAAIGLAKSQVLLGKADDAEKTVAAGLEQFPGSECREEMTRLRDGLSKGLRTIEEIYGS